MSRPKVDWIWDFLFLIPRGVPQLGAVRSKARGIQGRDKARIGWSGDPVCAVARCIHHAREHLTISVRSSTYNSARQGRSANVMLPQRTSNASYQPASPFLSFSTFPLPLNRFNLSRTSSHPFAPLLYVANRLQGTFSPTPCTRIGFQAVTQ